MKEDKHLKKLNSKFDSDTVSFFEIIFCWGILIIAIIFYFTMENK